MKHTNHPQTGVTYLYRKSQKILIEVFRTTSQNVQSSLVSTLLKPVGHKLQSAKIRTNKHKNMLSVAVIKMQYCMLG